ncbi:MAG: hypothetical protein AAGG11_12895 [Pseudomonadota bacterium]
MDVQKLQCTLVPLTDAKLFWVTFSGPLSLGRLTRAHQLYLRHPAYVSGMDELLDFSGTSLSSLKKPQLDLLRQYMLAQPEIVLGRTAMVVNTELEYGIGRMVSAMVEFDVPLQRFVSRSVADALEWLRPGEGDQLTALHDAQAAQGIEPLDLSRP